MPLLSLREAADMAGTSKSAMFRAIRAGRMSATRDDEGNYRVDPAEVQRAFEHKQGSRTAPERSDTSAVERTDTAPSDVTELRIRVAEEAARAKLAEERLADLKSMLEEMKAERERWRAQAERLALAAPTAPAPSIIPAESNDQRRGWWPWSRRSA